MFVLAMLMLIGSWAMAAEPVAGDTTTVPEPAVTSPPKVESRLPPAEPNTDPLPLDAEGVIEKPLDVEALLDELLAAMDQAVEELDREHPTSVAVQSQQLAVDRLKELLKTAEQSQSSNNSSSSSKNSQSSPSEANAENTQESNASEPSGNGGRRSDDQNSVESSEDVSGPTQVGSGGQALGARASGVWGHLPSREREALFRSLSESFLPEYRDQIERYYEAMAEKK